MISDSALLRRAHQLAELGIEVQLVGRPLVVGRSLGDRQAQFRPAAEAPFAPRFSVGKVEMVLYSTLLQVNRAR